ncbi:MAG: hypothetical protein K0S31_3480 [Sphingobacterium multivorum]|jgi:hypothetical protein|nr:hypothetical protein [Sphingobacterium multivorum]
MLTGVVYAQITNNDAGENFANRSVCRISIESWFL